MKIDAETIRSKLFEYDSPERLHVSHESFSNSAVLFSLMEFNNNINVILIKRTNVGSKHRGEMSFPGGRFDPNLDESLLDTALRETEEEIGVKREKIEILGCMDDLPTTTGYVITPFVGIIQNDVEMKKQEAEVEEIFDIPLNYFIDEQNFTETFFSMGSKKFPVYRYPKYGVWGATAHLIVTFIKQILDISLSKTGLKRLSADELDKIEIPKKGREKISKIMRKHETKASDG
jgi:8-oxo-dGTP pyrophosphatase MutT (NUDIX family)